MANEIVTALVAAGAALTGTLIANPVLERLKDRIGWSRRWSTRREDLVGTVRFLMGYLTAYEDARSEAFGDRLPPTRLRGLETLKRIDLTPVRERLPLLASIDDVKDREEGLAQVVVTMMVRTICDFEALRAFAIKIDDPTGHEWAEPVQQAATGFDQLRWFLLRYGPKIGIDGFSLAIDTESIRIMKEWHQKRSVEFNEKMADLQRKREALAEKRARLEEEADRKWAEQQASPETAPSDLS